jgi:hypothetical protein
VAELEEVLPQVTLCAGLPGTHFSKKSLNTFDPAVGGVQPIPEMPLRHLSYCLDAQYLISFFFTFFSFFFFFFGGTGV